MIQVLLLSPHERRHTPPSPLSHQEDLIQDLGLEQILDAMAQGDEYLYKVARRFLLESLEDPETIIYRQEVLRDCLQHSREVEEIYNITLDFMERKSRWWFLSTTRSSPSLVLGSSLHILETALDSLKKLQQMARNHGHAFQSRGFKRFFSMVEKELNDQYLAEVEGHVNALKFPRGALFQARLGPGNQGVGYQLCKPPSQDESWIRRLLPNRSPTYSFSIHPRDDHGLKVLANIRDMGLERVAVAVSKAADHIEGFFKTLREELAFYLGCLHLYREICTMEAPATFPTPLPLQGEEGFLAEDLYDLSLALTMGKRGVGNEVKAQGIKLVIISGPNRGGKTTFLRSVGQAQLMMQCGMFVPARTFTSRICRGLFTHFTREEDRALERGKLDEELERMSTIVDSLNSNSMVLLNESFSSTNEAEESELAKEIVGAMVERGVRVFFVTHFYEFSRESMEKEKGKVLFLRAERLPNGRRTFKIKKGEPLETNFGMDLYRRIFQGRDSPPSRDSG